MKSVRRTAEVGANYFDACFDGALAIENVSGHDCAVFRKGVRKVRRKLQPSKVVAVCDHLGFLLVSKLKHEIVRETIASSPRSGRMKIAHRFIGGDRIEYEEGVREADG